MKSNWHKALLASLLMIFSGLAGCLEADSIIEESSDDNDSEINSDTGNNSTSDTGNNSTSDTGNNTAGNVTVIPDYGTIMTSTYHVAQLVSAIVGPTATVEMMSTSKIPVHDYEPSLQDTVRLANSDVFFYHGLNLEPWVEGTLSILGSDAPPAYATHTMPSGEVTPDYQSLLVSDLCAQLSQGDREFNNLIAYENLASQLEIHLEKGVQSLTFPSADAASLEGHDHSDDDHDDHDDHGDHDDHDNHTDDDHGEHEEHEEYPICHNVETHENMEGTNQSDCEDAGNLWMEGAPNDGTRGYLTIHVENEGDYGFALPSHITAHILMGEGGHDDHDDHGGHDDHDDHGDESTIVSDDDEEEFEYDPHSWLDPVAFKAQTELVLNALIEQFPEGSDAFTANAQEFMLELDRIHIGYTNAFGESSTCTTNTVAANHNAYSYLTVRYGIEFVTVHGLDPEGEPSVADIAEVIEKINEDEINVLYIEEYTQRSAVDSIVEATNVEVLYLYTMEMSPTDSSDTYLTMMNKNLENLKTGMGCTA